MTFKRQRMGHKKVRYFTKNKIESIDYKDIELSKRFALANGKIIPRRVTSTCAKYRRMLATAIKRVRQMASLLYVSEQYRISTPSVTGWSFFIAVSLYRVARSIAEALRRREADDMNNQTRKITEGATTCAIVGLVLFINRQLGSMLGYLMYRVLTFPILVCTAKYGVCGAPVLSVSMLLLSFMISSPTTIFYLSSCIVVGLVYGGGARKDWKNGTPFVFSGVFTSFSYPVTTASLMAAFGYDPAEDIESVKTILELMNIHSGADLMKTVIITVVLAAVLMSVLQTMCVHMTGNILLSRLHIRAHPMDNTLNIRVPKWNGWLILVIWVPSYSGSVLKLNWEALTILLGTHPVCKAHIIVCGVICIMGLLVLLRKRAFAFSLMIAVFVSYVQDVIAVIGIADILFPLRDKMKRDVINGSFGKF